MERPCQRDLRALLACLRQAQAPFRSTPFPPCLRGAVGPSSLWPDILCALGLTFREAEVLAWVAQGKGNADIAEILGISARTVQKHLEHIFQKLGVETRTAAARVAYSVATRTSLLQALSLPKEAR